MSRRPSSKRHSSILPRRRSAAISAFSGSRATGGWPAGRRKDAALPFGATPVVTSAKRVRPGRLGSAFTASAHTRTVFQRSSLASVGITAPCDMVLGLEELDSFAVLLKIHVVETLDRDFDAGNSP